MKYTSESKIKKLVVVSHPEIISKETEAINTLFSLGLKYFHLRKPGLNKEKLEQFIKEIPPEYHRRVILHEQYDLVKKYNLKGIHISEKNKNSGFETEYKRYHQSISVHALNELFHLNNNYSYAFLSPVFNSISKQNYKSGFKINTLKKTFQQNKIQQNVIALGGVTPENIPKLKDLNFQGYAVLGYFWKTFSERADLSDLEEKFKKLKNRIYEK